MRSHRSAAALLAILGAALELYSQPNLPGFPSGKWWKDRRFVDELHLTSEQQSKIEAIWLENRRRVIDQKAELDKAQLDLNDALAITIVDEAEALRAFEAVQNARKALERTTFTVRVRTKNVLSPEQQQKLAEISERIRRERQGQRSATPPPG